MSALDVWGTLQPVLTALLEALAAIAIAQLTWYLRRKYQLGDLSYLERTLSSLAHDAIAYAEQVAKKSLLEEERALTNPEKLETAMLFAKRESERRGVAKLDGEHIRDLIEMALGYRKISEVVK